MAGELTAGMRAMQACKAFADRVDQVLVQLGTTESALADRAGVNPSTLHRMREGRLPQLATVARLVSAVAAQDKALGRHLIRDLSALCGESHTLEADYNHDGKEDRDDLLPCTVAIDQAAGELLELTVRALGNDGDIDCEEQLGGLRVLQRLHEHALRCEKLLGILNKAYLRKRSG